MMKAIIIKQPGGPDVLQVGQRPVPRVASNEVLIRVKAAGVNRPDVFQRKGNYAPPAGVVADIPGLEVAGIIDAVGTNVTLWRTGDEVCCLLAGGGYAEFATVHEELCLPIPVGLSFSQAAALPENLFTVWDNVFRRAILKTSEGILIHGGAGGIGSTAIQLCKAFGARVFTTVSTEEKKVFCQGLGADRVINYKDEDFSDVLAEESIDVILDSIGGAYFSKHIDVLNVDGRLVQINAMLGAKVELNLMKLMQKRIVLTGSTLRARSISFKSEIARELLDKVWPILGTKFIPYIHAEIELSEAEKAHEMMEKGLIKGKVVLVV